MNQSTATTSTDIPEDLADPMPLLEPFVFGDLHLTSRMVMAPLTRNRAGEGLAPTRMNARYYAQRATAGLIISEATQVDRRGLGYPNTPGIHSEGQVAGWRTVVSEVQRAGGRIFAQLWHVGRISHPDLQPDGQRPLAPSAVRPEGEAMTEDGMKAFEEPEAMSAAQIDEVVAQYRRGAECAKIAGFDGVEIHSANGYLLDQFLQDKTNERTDTYGGSIENRMRFPLRVLDEVRDIWPSHRIGVRISPCSDFNDIADSDPAALFEAYCEELGKRGLGYLHLIEGNAHDGVEEDLAVPTADVRRWFGGNLMVNSGYTKERGNAVIAEERAELVSFGRSFLANPDLVGRFQRNAELNEPDKDTFYGGGEEGYTDYPTLDQQED